MDFDAREAAWIAFSHGDWEGARAAFDESIAADESLEALEGLGAAAQMLNDDDLTFAARERAYRLYLDGGDWGPRAGRRVACRRLPAVPGCGGTYPASGLAGALVAGDVERLNAMLAADVRMRALIRPAPSSSRGRRTQGRSSPRGSADRRASSWCAPEVRRSAIGCTSSTASG
jgi:hypothetical protein